MFIKYDKEVWKVLAFVDSDINSNLMIEVIKCGPELAKYLEIYKETGSIYILTKNKVESSEDLAFWEISADQTKTKDVSIILTLAESYTHIGYVI